MGGRLMSQNCDQNLILVRFTLRCIGLVTIMFAGADFDIAQCSPGDLDPHAVASIFKAYLRERT